MADVSARVGVVVRTRSRASFLRRALADIQAQTYAAWRVVIVNDGGDASEVETVVASLPASTRERVSTIHLGENLGRPAAANAGVAALDTEFVVLHDDDDLWHPAFLARTIDWLDSHPADVGVVVSTEIVYEADRNGQLIVTDRVPMWPGLSEITYSEMLHLNRAVPISYLYRRSLHEEIGYYREDLPVVEDWEFNLRATLRYHIGFLAGPPLAYWMQRAGVHGDAGNSVVAMSGDHERYDLLVRDEALRAWVAENGPGLPLYLTRYITDELARQLDARRTLGQRLADAVRDWRRARRAR